MKQKKGQISIEYIIVVGFITAAIVSILAIAFSYSATLNDRIKENQVLNFGNEIISNAESVYYAGSPSQVTITPYLPKGVTAIIINNKDLVFKIQTVSGISDIGFVSKVPLTGFISTGEGIKSIVIKALNNQVSISST
jgi:hypothetical protein